MKNFERTLYSVQLHLGIHNIRLRGTIQPRNRSNALRFRTFLVSVQVLAAGGGAGAGAAGGGAGAGVDSFSSIRKVSVVGERGKKMVWKLGVDDSI